MNEISDRLAAVEEKIRSLREDKGRMSKVFAAAKEASAQNPESEATTSAALQAKDSLKEVERQLDAQRDEQTELLRRLGDMEAGKPGLPYSGGSGWHEAARRLDLSNGVNTVDIAGSSLLQAALPSGGGLSLRPTPASGTAGATSGLTGSQFFAYQAFQRADPGGAASVTDFTISFTSATVTGMERAPAAVTTKPVMPGSYALATPDVRQHAIIADGIPNRLFDSAAFGPFLDTELRRQVDLSVDRHVVAQITAASPPSGSSGSGLISKLRNGVASSRGLGAWPSVVLLSPSDSSSLDLSTSGADNLLVFPIRDTGSSSPLWSLQVVESAAVTNPTLVDPRRAAVLYVGGGTVTVDGVSGLSTNVSRIRCEIEALLHVRNPQSLFVVT